MANVWGCKSCIGRLKYWLLGVVLLLGMFLFLRFVPERPVLYDDIADHFKYGSIGSEPANGLPYWVWRVLPEMFPEKLPGKGYESLGFIYEPGRELPVGVSQRRVQGLDRVWLNCAVCHTSTIRDSANAPAKLMVGMPAIKMRLYDFIRFLQEVSLDNRFAPEPMLAKIEEIGGHLGFIDRLIYKYVAIDRTRKALLAMRDQLGFLVRQHDWGPGRVDTFNPYKALQFGYPIDKLPAAELNGPADYPSVWHQSPREGMQLHWDGNNTSVQERNLSAALGAGVTPASVDRPAIKRIENWLLDFTAPRYPHLAEVDLNKAENGKKYYYEYCAACHGAQEGDKYDFDRTKYPQLGKVDPINHIKTDRGRLLSYSEMFSLNQNGLYAGYPWRFQHFRKTNGYANMPLDGIWARAPYLHNGSVPTLRDLMEPQAKRPKVFYRGSNLYDWTRVGFVSDIPKEGNDAYFAFDTSVESNSNAGHDGEEFGTALPDESKDAIVEYMKTF
jgi:mono/diheme cytochrome c family protein